MFLVVINKTRFPFTKSFNIASPKSLKIILHKTLKHIQNKMISKTIVIHFTAKVFGYQSNIFIYKFLLHYANNRVVLIISSTARLFIFLYHFAKTIFIAFGRFTLLPL